MKITEIAVRRPVTTTMFFCAIVLLGTISIFKLNVDMFPDISPPIVSILTTWPGASASDVEQEVTKVIEDRVVSVNNLDSITSKSLDNLSVISCKFNWGTNLDVATNDLRDRLELAKRDLPDDAETPILYKFSSATAPIMFMTVTAKENWDRLYRIVDFYIADELKRVEGVGTIQLYGGLRRRINVYFDLEKINGYGLSLVQINNVLKAQNLNIPGGRIKSGLREYFIRVPERFTDIEQIKNTIIGQHNGAPIYLKDIARVEDTYKPMDLNGWGDGKRAIVLILQKQTGKNTVKVVERVKKRILEIEKTLPKDVKITIVSDTAEDILKSLKNMRNSLIWAIIFIVLATILFLRELRPAVIISLIIPCSLIISFIFLYMENYTINVITLMALAISSGMVVDNGIVVLENIYKYIEKGATPKVASIFGTSEMSLAITASSMTTIIIFVPLMFLGELTGILFKQLGFVIVFTILASLITALTLTPMLSSKWLTPNNKEKKGILAKLYHLGEKAFTKIEDGYSQLLIWSLKNRLLVIIGFTVLFVSSLSLIPFISTSFLPEVDSGDVTVDFRLSEGTRIEVTNKVIDDIFHHIDKNINKEYLRHSYAFDGQSETGEGVALGFDEGPNVGEIGLKLVDRDKRDKSAKEIANELRQYVENIPGVEKLKVDAQDPITSILMGRGKPVTVEFQGDDLTTLTEVGYKLLEKIKDIPGITDVSLSQKPHRPEIWIKINREKASSLGISVGEIAQVIRNYFYGVEATKFRESGDDYDIFTRLSENDKNDLESLKKIYLISRTGEKIPLTNLVDIKFSTGPIEIQRKNREKIVSVEAVIYGISLGEAEQKVKEVIKNMNIPIGISWKFGGKIEEQKKAFKDLTILLLLGILLVYMTMASLFENFRDPLIIMFSVPFAFTGVFYVFYFFNLTLSVTTFMGIIMLIGIVVNNAIVLVDYTHLLQKRGNSLYDSVINAGKSRLRPVLMTTFTTFMGMVPMAFSRAVGAEVWNPLGRTILGGLTVSTFVTLILIPTIYYTLEKRKIKE